MDMGGMGDKLSINSSDVQKDREKRPRCFYKGDGVW